MKITEIHRSDNIYPALLREIKNPPKLLYCAGNIEILKTRCVAVVGSRKTTEYGRWVGRRLGEEAALGGLTVVSGLALGIDACSHRGALEKGGKTIAVLGCGLDVVYPVHNRNLKDMIEREGLLISEYHLGFTGTKYSFPARNRIISGLSEAVVVAEAGINSGALITAAHGADQGRPVYAVPGNINNSYSMGGNMLLRDGAIPLVVLDDLLRDLGAEKKQQDAKYLNLGQDEKKVLALLEGEGELSLDALGYALGMSVGKVSGIVTILEMKGITYTALGKVFVAK
jgi:DNA processing protein